MINTVVLMLFEDSVMEEQLIAEQIVVKHIDPMTWPKISAELFEPWFVDM